MLTLGCLLLFGSQLIRDEYSDEEREIRRKFRYAAQEHYPQEASRIAAGYGLKKYQGDQSGKNIDPNSAVVLIHGLDDPGKVWMNLAPILAEAGFSVWIMSYPDDQPIDESAFAFHQALVNLRRDQGVARVDIVAHSMGGLVSRDLLTHARHVAPGALPEIDSLIMVGTPNAGSELSRFRLIAEVRDHTVAMLNGELHWLGWLFDGAGEAGIDLTPGSRFLRTLNARPHAPGTRLVVIAGVIGHIEKKRIQDTLSRYFERLPADTADSIMRAGDLVEGILQRVGDGLVTVESARLEGAEFHLVEGTHLSIIRNVLETSDRIPPAVPIILRELTMDHQGVMTQARRG